MCHRARPSNSESHSVICTIFTNIFGGTQHLRGTQAVLTKASGSLVLLFNKLDIVFGLLTVLACQVLPKSGDPASPFEAVLLLNKEGKQGAPTVLTPHGGPHSAFPAVYLLSNAYLNALGYNVLQVNYR